MRRLEAVPGPTEHPAVRSALLGTAFDLHPALSVRVRALMRGEQPRQPAQQRGQPSIRQLRPGREAVLPGDGVRRRSWRYRYTEEEAIDKADRDFDDAREDAICRGEY